MSCYLRHLKAELDEVGVEVTKENRKDVDKAIHRIAGVDHKDCPEAWKEVKRMLAEDREAFLARLRKELGD